MAFPRALGVAACLLMGVSVAHAQVPSAGTVVSQSIQVNDKTVPLPQGNWTVVTVQNSRSTHSNKALTRLYLADVDHGVLSRWVFIGTNAEYNKDGWKRDKEVCDRKNVHFGYSDSSHNENDAECWIVNHWGMAQGSNSPQATVNFYRWSDTLGRPNTALGVEYFFAKNGDLLNLQVQYNPVVDGFPDTPTALWRGNPWHPDLASKDPKRLAYLRALKTMGEEYFQKLRKVVH